MGEAGDPPRVMLMLAVFSRYDEALDWALERAVQTWGDVALTGERFRFDQTDYYRPSMGPDLIKQLVAFETPIDPAKLIEIKHQTNGWEQEYAEAAEHPESRPLNLDPGYLTRGKFVLATTKDASHRLYLGRGIFAEVTLHFAHGTWQLHPWTYLDYRREECHTFLTRCRELISS